MADEQLPLFPGDEQNREAQNIGKGLADERTLQMLDAMIEKMQTLASVTEQMRDTLDISGVTERARNSLEGMHTASEKLNRSIDDRVKSTDKEIESHKIIAQYLKEQNENQTKIAQMAEKSESAIRGRAMAVGLYRKGVYHLPDQPIYDAAGKLIRIQRGRTVTDEEFRTPGSPGREETIRAVAQATTIEQARGTREFNPLEFIRELRQGNIGGAIGEAFQQVRGTGGISNLFERMGGRISGMGTAGRVSGTLAEMGGALLPAAAETFLSPAALTYLGLRGVRRYQEDLRLGLQTGLSGTAAVRETEGARGRAFLQGINPFDALTVSAARAIAKGIESEGFTGDTRKAWQETVGNLVKQTGLDAQTALDQMKFSVETLGQTVDQFQLNMSHLNEVAAQTDLSIGAIIDRMRAFEQPAVGVGSQQGIQQFGMVGRTLGGIFPVGAAGTNAVQAIAAGQLTGNVPLVTYFGGGNISPLERGSKRAADQIGIALDHMVSYLTRVQKTWGMDLDTFTQVAVNSGMLNEFLPGITPIGLKQIMLKGKDQGFERAIAGARIQESEDLARQQERRQRGQSFFHRITGAIGNVANPVLSGEEKILSLLTGDTSRVTPGQAAKLLEYQNPLFPLIQQIFRTPNASSQVLRQRETPVLNTTMAMLQRAGFSNIERQKIRSLLTEQLGTQRFGTNVERLGQAIGAGAAGTTAAHEIILKLDLTPSAKTVIENPTARINKINSQMGRGGTQGSG